jgi:hypothetical protein
LCNNKATEREGAIFLEKRRKRQRGAVELAFIEGSTPGRLFPSSLRRTCGFFYSDWQSVDKPDDIINARDSVDSID